MSPDTTAIVCRCCGKPVETGEQRTWDGKSSITLLTCWNRDDKCRLCGYTFALPDYAEIDTSLYHWREGTWKNR